MDRTAQLPLQKAPIRHPTFRRFLEKLKFRVKIVNDQTDLESGQSSTTLSIQHNSTDISSAVPTSTAPTSNLSDLQALGQPENPVPLSVHEPSSCYYYGGWFVHEDKSGVIDQDTSRRVKELQNVWLSRMAGKPFSFAALMTSQHREELPSRTFLITCDSESDRREAQNMLSDGDCGWLHDFAKENRLIIRFSMNTTNSRVIHASASTVEKLRKYERSCCLSITVPQSATTSCGLQITLWADGDESRHCTLGGIICIDGELFAMTTEHSFRLQRTSEGSDMAKKAYLPYNVYFFSDQSGQAFDLDCAFIQLSQLPTSLLQRLLVGNMIKNQRVRATRSVDPSYRCKVDVQTSTAGIVQAYLNGTSQLVHVGSSIYSAYLLTMQEHLEVGCSGSWVFQDNDLVGYIVAIHTDLPWAYMLSIEDAFEQIQTRLGLSIDLPSENAIHNFIMNRTPVVTIMPTGPSFDVLKKSDLMTYVYQEQIGTQRSLTVKLYTSQKHQLFTPFRHSNQSKLSLFVRHKKIQWRDHRACETEMADGSENTERVSLTRHWKVKCAHIGSISWLLVHVAPLQHTFGTDDTIEILKKKLQESLTKDYQGRSYMPTEKLKLLLPNSTLLSVVHYYLSKASSKTAIPLKKQVIDVSGIRRIIAIFLLAGIDLTCFLLRLTESGVDDRQLPLNLSDTSIGLLAEELEKFHRQQWACAPFESFHETLSITNSHNDYPWCSVLHDHLVLPFQEDPMELPSRLESQWRTCRVTFDIGQNMQNSRAEKAPVYILKQYKTPNSVKQDSIPGILSKFGAMIRMARHDHIAKPLAVWYQQETFNFLHAVANFNLSLFMDVSPPPTLSKDTALALLEEMRGVSDALRCLHALRQTEQRCCHMDLKPSNILVFTERNSIGTWRISDFGISRSISWGEAPVRTPCWKSNKIHSPDPEALASASRAFDIFSLGCIFLEIIAWASGTSKPINDKRLDQFWQLNTLDRVMTHPTVKQKLKSIKDWSGHRGVFLQLISLIETMLHSNHKLRPNAASVTDVLDANIHQAELELAMNEDFYLSLSQPALTRLSSSQESLPYYSVATRAESERVDGSDASSESRYTSFESAIDDGFLAFGNNRSPAFALSSQKPQLRKE